MTEIPPLPDAPTGSIMRLGDINNNGQVAGACYKSGYPPDFERGFLWDAKKGFTELPPIEGDTHSAATGINNNGQVAGQSTRYVLRPDGGYNIFWTAVVWDTRGTKP